MLHVQFFTFYRGHGHLLSLGYLSEIVSLPASNLKIKGNAECKQHLSDLSNAPWKLKDLCRIAIRRHLGFTWPYAKNVLPLPTALKLYLQMEDTKWCFPCVDCEENDFVIDFRS